MERRLNWCLTPHATSPPQTMVTLNNTGRDLELTFPGFAHRSSFIVHRSSFIVNHSSFILHHPPFTIRQPEKLYVSEGPLAYQYQLTAATIHFGLLDSSGSQHQVDGLSMPGEVGGGVVVVSVVIVWLWL